MLRCEGLGEVICFCSVEVASLQERIHCWVCVVIEEQL